MAHGGEAIGRHEGRVVFVPYALPGERALIRLEEEHARYARGTLVELLEPSPNRVAPPCKHFGVCGGCQWQHMAYPAQLEQKRLILQDALQRIGHLDAPPVGPVAGMELPWHYRNHVQFAVDDEGDLGYMAARSHDLVAIEECYLPHPILEDVLVALDLELPEVYGLTLRAGVNTQDPLVIFESELAEMPEFEIDVPVSCVLANPEGELLILAGRDHIYEELAGRRYRISAPSFFQVNTEQAARLVQLVAQALEPQGDETLLDMYCGVGTFGLALAAQVGRVIGVEESPHAVQDALENAAQDDNVEILEGQVEEVLPELVNRVDLVVLDPPRAGLKAPAREALLRLAPRRMAYVSCDPASLARDLEALVAAGYAVRQIWPVDMFPQTYHIETVTLLER